MKQVTIRAPPKAVFDSLCDPTLIEEFTDWRVTEGEGRFGEGFTWEEKRGLKKRAWTVTGYERRGLSFTAEWKGVRLTMSVKKGGTGSCNVQMRVDGDAKAVARFEKSDGDRLDGLKAFWDG